MNAAQPAAPAPRRQLLGLYLLLLGCYALFTMGHFSSTDQITVYFNTVGLFQHHSLAVPAMNGTVPCLDGQHCSKYGLGQPVLQLPLYLAGRAVEQFAPPALRQYFSGPNLGPWGGTPSIFFVSLFNILLSPLLGVLLYLLLLDFGFSRRLALATTLVFALCTATLVYARESFQHPLETFALLGAFCVLFHYRRALTPRATLLAGVLLAVGVLTRANLLLVVPLVVGYAAALLLDRTTLKPLGVALARRDLDELRRLLASPAVRHAAGCLIALGVPLLAAVALMAASNYVRFGQLMETGYGATGINTRGGGFSNPPLIGLFGYLISPGRGIFWYSPPILLALFGFRALWRAWPREALLFLGISLVYLLSYAAWWYWDGGWSFGPRFMLPLVPLFMIAAAYCLQRRLGVLAMAVLAGLGLGVQFVGAITNYGPIYFEWMGERLIPENAYLFVPEISPIPRHIAHVLRGQSIDLWLVWLYHQFGPATALSTALLPLLLIVRGLLLLSGDRRPSGAAQPPPPATADPAPAERTGSLTRELP